MEYFYTPPDLIAGDRLRIEGDEFAHLTHVMRRKVHDTIMVVDGIGNAYEATIAGITKREAECTIQARHRQLHEPDTDITLGVAVLKNASNFDFLLEKCTELGVRTIVPLHTNRTIPSHAKTERWQKLALAAMKQSGRCFLPIVLELTPLATFLANTSAVSLKLIPHEKTESPRIRQLLQGGSHSAYAACIGPEGGFTDEEINSAVQHGYSPVTLGKRRLRTETAAIVTVAALVE